MGRKGRKAALPLSLQAGEDMAEEGFRWVLALSVAFHAFPAYDGVFRRGIGAALRRTGQWNRFGRPKKVWQFECTMAPFGLIVGMSLATCATLISAKDD